MSDTSSDEDESAAERKAFMRQLCGLIERVHSSGSFAAFGSIDAFVNPGIFVDPIGIVRLPLSESDAQTLVQTSHKAPFGKGSETLVDESVRKTWQIDAANVQFLNENWQCCLDQVVERVARELGIASECSDVHAEFYKLLLYEKGAMFKPHQDTEKVPGMFATLIICLPSEHTGGAVCLRHGSKSERFDSSGNSAFGASYLAWYADVVHEIKPIQTGYRWVLVYNLVNHFQGPPQSASALDARIKQFTQALTSWQDLTDAPGYLAYPLGHQYPNRNLNLSHLKGNDFYRARHVAQSCAAHGEFYVFLGNMEMCITDENCEEDRENESVLSLCRLVNLQGSSLSVHSTMTLSDINLLHGASYEDREPDVQRGGNYTGNQYAEIDQFFKDSILIIVPRDWTLNFFLRRGYTHSHLHHLMNNFRSTIKKGDNSGMRDLLLHTCTTALAQDYASYKDKDLYLGPVAVSAAFLEDSRLFSTTTKELEGSFGEDYYYALGELNCLQSHMVEEDDIIAATTKCGKVFQVYANLDAFRNGFFKGNAYRSDQVQANSLKRWLDTLMYDCLCTSEEVCKHDARTLINIILEREDMPFSQFVLYQGVRIFVKHFQADRLLINAMVVEFFSRPDSQGRSKIYLDSLLYSIVESAISNFDLCQYAMYIELSKIPGVESLSRRYGGPFKAFYEYACAWRQDSSIQLLRRIKDQASELTAEQSNVFLISFLYELIPIVDVSSVEVQECIRSLISVYILRRVGHEPKKPTDWTRLEEMKNCWRKEACKDCQKMNAFLKDPELKYLALEGMETYHLESGFEYFKYFDIEKRGWTTIAVTKTLKWWEEDHLKWQTRASSALEALRKLPQDRLKDCLGHEYDDFMDLRMVKVVDDPPDSNEKGNHSSEPGSSVPQKRARQAS